MQQLAAVSACKRPEVEMEVLSTSAASPMQSVEDLSLAERIKAALKATGYGELRVVEVSVTTQIVVLFGRVPSYYLKQVAQVTALAVPGTHHIHNGLNVVRPS
jgi:osmotically-inducible protein OsmY